jgi:hypothetical protein
VLLWDITDDVPRHRLSGFAAEVVNMFFHPTRPWLAVGDRGGMRMWDVTNGALILRDGAGVPWGFSRDGLVMAASNTTTLSFHDLTIPRELQRMRGHRTFIQRIVWARSSPRLASLDGAFEVNVWEVGRSEPLARLRGPVGSFGVTNAAIALDDDGARLAFASGGEPAAAMILELAPRMDERQGRSAPALVAPRQRGPWPLEPGFDRLACPGKDRFLLVREEKETRPADVGVAIAWPVRSVAYELTDAGPKFLRVIRPSRPSDVRRFLESGLTPDGRYYWWTGPRLPEADRRIEVRQVATGALVWRLSAPAPLDNSSQPSCKTSPDGYHLWVQRPEVGARRYDLPDDQAGELEEPPDAYLPGRWRLDREARPAGAGDYLLSEWGKNEAWLRLENEDQSTPTVPAFSPNGRFLAWTDDGGTLTVADLDSLRETLKVFEQEPVSE